MPASSPLDPNSTASRFACPATGDAADVERLGEAIAHLAARIHAATYELLALIRQFDERAGWNNGFLSCAHWLSWRTGIDPGAAREKVRVARALAALPQISAAMQRGALSYAKVRALTRVATPTNEAQLLDVARSGTAAHVERLVRAWRRVDRIEAAQEGARRHLHRELHTWVDEDGMLVIRGRLTPEVGAIVQRAVEAAADRLYREAAQSPDRETVSEEVTPAQRRADALGLVAESALSADLDRGTAGDRYQVVLHVEPETLHAGTNGHAVLDDPGGQHVSAETSRRLACDAALVVMRHASDGTVLDVGRRSRTIPPAIRRALMARDARCRFPGCTARRCDAHHIDHWADGGATRLEHLVRLCRRHHRIVHEGGWRIERRADGDIAFVRPDGRVLPAAPDVRDLAVKAPSIIDRRTADEIAIDSNTTTPAWDGAPFDVGWALDVLRTPVEARRRSDSASVP